MGGFITDALVIVGVMCAIALAATACAFAGLVAVAAVRSLHGLRDEVRPRPPEDAEGPQ
jgi:hypothetical protein